MPYYELTIIVPDSFRDQLIRIVMEEGSLGIIEEESSITAYFPESADIGGVIGHLEVLNMVLEKSGCKELLRYSHVLIADQDWNESWKQGFQPLQIGERFTILPPWEIKHQERINLIIDPGMAFGTGHHATTRSCLILMEKYINKARKERFLDLGTGTGLLAIAASKIGYKQIVAVDTDPLAIEASRMNQELNCAPEIEIREGSIEAVSGFFDVIAANIISTVLFSLAPSIAAKLNKPGIAILSGMLQGQEKEVSGEMERNGLRIKEHYHDDKWVSLVLST